MKKLIEKLKGYLPVTRKLYKKDHDAIMLVLDGLKQTDVYHTQMENNLLENMKRLQVPTPTKKQNGKSDPAFM